MMKEVGLYIVEIKMRYSDEYVPHRAPVAERFVRGAVEGYPEAYMVYGLDRGMAVRAYDSLVDAIAHADRVGRAAWWETVHVRIRAALPDTI